MKITYKLNLGFAVVIILTLLLGYFSIQISQTALRNVIGERSVLITEQLMLKVETRIQSNIKVFEEFITDPVLLNTLKKSNTEFESLPERETLVAKRDTDWVDAADRLTPVAGSIFSNDLSARLKEKLLFYVDTSSNPVFGSVFITNRYGANVAMSTKSARYLHSNEQWWHNTIDNGYEVTPVSFGDSSKSGSIAVSLRIDSPEGELLGVLQMTINMSDIVGIINHFEQIDGNENVDLKLSTSNGKLLYTTGIDEHFYTLNNGNLFDLLTDMKGYITVKSQSSDGASEEEELFAYTRSVNFGNYAGLSWVMIAEYNSEEAFSVVDALKQWLFIIISVVTVLALLMSYLISRAISRPLAALEVASSGLGKGDFTTRIPIDSNDEMSGIGKNFNKMAERLEAAMLERDKEIVERQTSEEAVIQMAYYDQLTGLPNRNLFMDRLDSMIKRDLWRKRLAALFYMDLDRFKVVNDSLGHAEGDKLLKAVANRLKLSLRDGDVIARLGGDEFGILLQDLARVEDLPMVVEKIFDSFRDPLILRGEEVSVSGCIGVSIFPHDGDNAATLLKNAEIAMYRAKSEGKNMYKHFAENMAVKTMEALRIESVLDTAVVRDLLVLHYQPQLSLETGKITGTEALVRLKDPEGGLIPPIKFIDIAEETGLIVEIGDWVLKTACAQGRKWHDAGHDTLNVSVNVSACMFKQAGFVASVAKALEVSGFSPEHLDLEITESVVMTDAEEAIKKMHKLKALGVKFSVDDFGTGYSSLSYMKHMPIDMLKIDRSFVNDIMTDTDDRSIITAIITMAHSLGIDVIAEGVEERDQLDMLVSLGCNKLQGYYFSRPVPAHEHTLKLSSGDCLDMKMKAI